MINQNPTNISSQKHNQLLKIASLSRIFAWIVLFINLIFIVADLYQVLDASVWDTSVYFSEDRFFLINFVIDELILIIRGIMNWLILMGIAMGLFMVIETDYNYREFQNEVSGQKKISNEEDKPAIFYDPKYIIRLESKLSYAAMFSVFLSILINMISIKSLNAVVTSFIPGRPDLSGIPWVITIFLTIITIAIQSLIFYYSLRSLGRILLIVMEMEFNSRFVMK